MSSMTEQAIVMLMKGNSNDSINQMKKVKESSNALVSVLKGNPKETSLVGFSRSVKRVSCVRVRNPDSGSGQGLTKTTRKRKFAQFFSLDVQMNIRNRNKLSWSINQWSDFLQIQPKCYSSNYQTQTRVRQYKLTKTNQEARWKQQWKLFNIATTIQNQLQIQLVSSSEKTMLSTGTLQNSKYGNSSDRRCNPQSSYQNIKWWVG